MCKKLGKNTWRFGGLHAAHRQTLILTDRQKSSIFPLSVFSFFIRTLTSGKPQCENNRAAPCYCIGLRRGPTLCILHQQNYCCIITLLHIASAELLQGYCIIVASQFSAFKLHHACNFNWGCILSALSQKVFNWQSFKVDQDAHQGSKVMCAQNWAEIPGGFSAYSPQTYIQSWALSGNWNTRYFRYFTLKNLVRYRYFRRSAS